MRRPRCPRQLRGWPGRSLSPPICWLEPTAWRQDTTGGIRRPVHSPAACADKVLELRGQSASLPSYISWGVAWENWREWLLEGIE